MHSVVELSLVSTRSCAIRTTTLYDVITTLQDTTGPDGDDLAVTTVVSLLRSGQLILGHKAQRHSPASTPWRPCSCSAGSGSSRDT
jgi:hypothetical protein